MSWLTWPFLRGGRDGDGDILLDDGEKPFTCISAYLYNTVNDLYIDKTIHILLYLAVFCEEGSPNITHWAQSTYIYSYPYTYAYLCCTGPFLRGGWDGDGDMPVGEGGGLNSLCEYISVTLSLSLNIYRNRNSYSYSDWPARYCAGVGVEAAMCCWTTAEDRTLHVNIYPSIPYTPLVLYIETEIPIHIELYLSMFARGAARGRRNFCQQRRITVYIYTDKY